ncbi:transcription factor A, mitochondrial [Candoia aspera]|uniref:transcription factor A, mitochondrial n=1 Tax=Candoia aspera TaxID=51853 RepID=UPI002FD81EF6
MAAALLARMLASVYVSGPRCILRSGVTCSLEKCFSKYTSSDSCPKRPLTPYLNFLKDQRHIYQKKYPELNSQQFTKQMGRIWRELPESEKQHYEAIAKAEWDIFREQMAKYKSGLSPVQEAALKEERRKKRQGKKEAKIKKELAALGKPKRNRSAFNIFFSENFQEIKGTSNKEKLTALSEEWKNLPSSQKQIYCQLAEDDKIRYDNEKRSWEQQMKEAGREDVLNFKFTRTRTRKKPITEPLI